MNIALNDIVNSELLETFRKDSAVPHGLPAIAYNNRDYWELENQRLFAKSWVFVAFAHELPEPGDATPITVGGKPLFIIRDKEHCIRAFHNVCRHRCLKLIDEAANVGPRIRCPYHSWVYGLNGDLRSTPYFGGPEQHIPDGFDPKENGLVSVNCRVWHDWVFVNLADEPQDFDTFVAPLSDRVAGIDFEKVTPVATIDFGEVRTNWKLLMENFIEPYHVQFVHSSTTEQPLKDHHTVIDKSCLGSAVDISNPAKSGKNTLAVDSLYLTLFPNFVFGSYVPNQIGVHLNMPVSVSSTTQKRVIYMTDGETHDQSEIEALKDLWYNVHKEDHAMVERLQAGKSSDVAVDGGLLSPHWENSVRKFQRLALDAVS